MTFFSRNEFSKELAKIKVLFGVDTSIEDFTSSNAGDYYSTFDKFSLYYIEHQDQYLFLFDIKYLDFLINIPEQSPFYKYSSIIDLSFKILTNVNNFKSIDKNLIKIYFKTDLSKFYFKISINDINFFLDTINEQNDLFKLNELADLNFDFNNFSAYKDYLNLIMLNNY